MRTIRVLLYAMSVLLTQNCYAGLLYPTAKITVRAIDSKGYPVPDAEVGILFYVDKGVGMGWGLNSNEVTGKTDKDGLFSGEGSSIDRCSFSVEKNGFYDSYDEIHFQKISILKRWEPWNPTVDIVLKDKRKPMAMYAKRTDNLKVPILDTPIGYDLEKGDWVAPYGKGLVKDFIFICKAKYLNIYNTETSYKLIFSNAMDGIQEYVVEKNDRSDFRWPYEAPETGYQPELSLSDSYNVNHKYTSGYDKKKQYIFRVRTQVAENGNIVSANYGKLEGDIALNVNKEIKGGLIKLEYYFNPSGSRSLEYGSCLTQWSNKRERETQEVKGP